jgi:hypothetical protein
MSNLRCSCGNVIADQGESLPYKAALFRDADRPAFWHEVEEEIGRFMAHRDAGERRRWVEGYFGCDTAADRSDPAIIAGIFHSSIARFRRVGYECGACGKLWVQVSPEENRFRGYQPDEGGPGLLGFSSRVGPT